MIFWFSSTRCGRAAVLFFTSQHVSLSLETATQPASSICLNQFSVGCSSYCSVSGNKTHAGEQAHQEDEFFFFEHASALCTLVQRAPLSLFNLDTEPGVEAPLSPPLTTTTSLWLLPFHWGIKNCAEMSLEALQGSFIHHRKNCYVEWK